MIILVFIATAEWLIFYNQKETYLYAWERPEDFSFLEKDSNVTVVFYVGGISITDNGLKITKRGNVLNIPDGIDSFPFIRIDNFSKIAALESSRNAISNFIVSVCSGHEKCQLDFEAKVSEYEFYQKLLVTVAKDMPKTKISITGLASWCSRSAWFDQGPISAVVPMLYRLGPSSRAIKGGSMIMANRLCEDSVALSMDELDINFKKYVRGKDVYIFNPNSWTSSDYEKVVELLK